jgi:Flp pilus assembly protein TadD
MNEAHKSAGGTTLALCCAALLGGCTAPITTPHLANGTSNAMVRLGDDMRASGDINGALGFYLSAAAHDTTNPLPLIREGAAYTALGQPLRAQQAYHAALVIDPGSTDAKIGLAATLISLRQPDAALDLLLPIAQDSHDPRALRDYGVALDLTGHQQEAQAAYHRGLTVAPIDPDLHGDLGLSLALSGDYNGALDEMRQAITAPQGRGWMPANQILLLALAGHADEAQTLGARTVGEAHTAELLERAQRIAAADTPMRRAEALGLVNGSAAGAIVTAATSAEIPAAPIQPTALQTSIGVTHPANDPAAMPRP